MHKIGHAQTAGLRKAIVFVLQSAFSPARVKEFRDQLRQRLEGDIGGVIVKAKDSLAKAGRSCERLARQLREVDSDDDFISREYTAAQREEKQLRARLETLERGLAKIDKVAIERQLDVEPLELLVQLLEHPPSVEKAQAVIGRLFPRIVFVARPRKFTALFEFHVAVGVGLAEAAKTAVIDDRVSVVRVLVITSAKRPVEWKVIAA